MGPEVTLGASHDQKRDVTACPWSACDLLAIALVVSWLISVVEIWPIPISPIVYLPFLLLAAGWSILVPWFGPLLRYWPVRFLFVIYAYFIWAELSAGWGYSQISQSGRWIAGSLGLMCLAAYARSHSTRLTRLVVTICCLLSLSILWFVLEMRIGGPFIVWREWQYSHLYANVPKWLFENTRSGLTPWLHLLGYQIAAVAPLLALPILLARSDKAMAALIPLPWVAYTLLFIAIWFSAQRAALLAALSVIVALPLIFRTRQAVLMACVIVAAGGTARLAVSETSVTPVPAADSGLTSPADSGDAVPLVPAAPEITPRRWNNQTLNATIGDKLFKGIYQSELIFRLKLQQRALFLILTSPFGLERAGRTWNVDGLKYVRDRHPVFYARTIGVHNSILAYSLDEGWVVFVPAVLMLVGLGLISVRLLWSAARQQSRLTAIGGVVTIAFLNVTLLEAMTHNASLLNQEPTSMIFFALLLAVDLFRRTELESVPVAAT